MNLTHRESSRSVSLSLTLVVDNVGDWSGASRTRDCFPFAPALEGIYGWVVRGAIPPATEVQWTTLRARVCSYQRLPPLGRSSQWCLLLQQGSRRDGPRSAPVGAQEMQGGEQQITTCARASRGCSRPRTAQQSLITIAQVNGKMLRTFRHLSDRQSSIAARSHSSAAGLDFIKLSTTTGIALAPL